MEDDTSYCHIQYVRVCVYVWKWHTALYKTPQPSHASTYWHTSYMDSPPHGHMCKCFFKTSHMSRSRESLNLLFSLGMSGPVKMSAPALSTVHPPPPQPAILQNSSTHIQTCAVHTWTDNRLHFNKLHLSANESPDQLLPFGKVPASHLKKEKNTHYSVGLLWHTLSAHFIYSYFFTVIHSLGISAEG